MIRFLFSLILFLCLSTPVQAKSLPVSVGNSFAQIPVMNNGRVKPLDSFARTYLQIFSGKQSLTDMSAHEWLAELIFTPQLSQERAVFIINNPDVLSQLGLEKTARKLYSFNDISDALLKNSALIKSLYEAPYEALEPAQQQVRTLYEKTFVFLDLSRSLSLILPDFTPQSAELAALLKSDTDKPLSHLQVLPHKNKLEELAKTIKVGSDGISPKDAETLLFLYKMEEIQQEHISTLLRILPSQFIDNVADNLWLTPWELFQQGQGSPQTAEILDLWTELAGAYRSGNDEAFRPTSQTIREHYSAGNQKITWEYRYNQWSLFTVSLGFYILSFLLLLGSSLLWQKPLQKAACYALSVGGLLHITGIIMRMVIMSRPPVTNLYESILFVGIITVIFALIIERRRKDNTGLMMGSISGIILQFLGTRFAIDGGEMKMLEAVLDTNFWLATHVVTITIGYACCLVAGIIAHFYMYQRIRNPQATEQLATLARNIRGVALVALFFSALGTILGGIWADQSWGRFWGWDPKENGALLICLWLSWLIHGRLGGIIREAGFAAGMIITNVIVALAWFGVNLLGVGLHSYGFTSGAAYNLFAFCSVEILIAAAGYMLIRRRA